MGNGANSRPEHPVVMSTRRVPPSNASQQPGFSDYVANGVHGYDQRFQPQYGSQSHYPGNSGFSNGWEPRQSDGYGYHGTYGQSVASNPRAQPRKDRDLKNHQESSHQSALSMHHQSRRVKPNEQSINYGNRGGHQSWEEGNANSDSDEILFEVYHCFETRRDYNVINVDGVRYLVNSWDGG